MRIGQNDVFWLDSKILRHGYLARESKDGGRINAKEKV